MFVKNHEDYKRDENGIVFKKNLKIKSQTRSKSVEVKADNSLQKEKIKKRPKSKEDKKMESLETGNKNNLGFENSESKPESWTQVTDIESIAEYNKTYEKTSKEIIKSSALILSKENEQKTESTTCQNYFKSQPIYFPDISISDFAINSQGKTFSSKKFPTVEFRSMSDYDIIDKLILTEHTRPEYVNKSKSIGVFYQFDTMFSIIQRKNPSEQPAKHKFFYLLAEFFKLFEEGISQFVVDEIIFFECFREKSITLPNKQCPDFLREWVELLKNNEEFEMERFVNLDLNYIYENPIKLYKDLNHFLKKGLEYSLYYQINDENFFHYSKDGFNKIYNSPLDIEALSVDGSAMAFHKNFVRSVIPPLEYIKKKLPFQKTRRREKRQLEENSSLQQTQKNEKKSLL